MISERYIHPNKPIVKNSTALLTTHMLFMDGESKCSAFQIFE